VQGLPELASARTVASLVAPVAGLRDSAVAAGLPVAAAGLLVAAAGLPVAAAGLPVAAAGLLAVVAELLAVAWVSRREPAQAQTFYPCHLQRQESKEK